MKKTDKQKKEKCYTENGYIALISVLISGAVVSSITISAVLFGVGISRNSFAVEQAIQAKVLTNTCIEEGLQQIRDLNSFTGSANIVLGQGSCTYTVTDTGGNTREITATGIVGTITKKVRVTIDSINPRINISSWEEVADF